MNHFEVTQPLPNVFHIQDAGGVCFTLLRGETDTLLWDTGMGFFDVAACIAPYVRGKLHVVLSHGHYDHVCGQHYFANCYVHSDDLQLAKRSSSVKVRKYTLERMKARGVIPKTYPDTQFIPGTPNSILSLPFPSLALGNLTVEFLHTPGHTIGSMVAYVPQLQLILTGDMWNPTTWLFFPESQPLSVYSKTMQQLLSLDAVHVLCAHALPLTGIDRLHAYIHGLNAEIFTAAEPCSIPPYTNINTCCVHPEPESTLVFNDDKR